MSTHNLSRIMKNIRIFLSEKNFIFLVIKFSVYLNRHVFIMHPESVDTEEYIDEQRMT